MTNTRTFLRISTFSIFSFISCLFIENIDRPHCDSSCDGTEHLKGGRIATAVLYCKVAESGGATTFVRSNVFVKPKNGSATFFAYMGPDKLMDPMSLTEHSGCPVMEGEKWITTFWMREGVTELDPWTHYDPSGVRMMTAPDMVEEYGEPELAADDLADEAVTPDLQSAIDEL